MVPDVRCKILKWLKNNVHLSTLETNLKGRIELTVTFKASWKLLIILMLYKISESDVADPVAVKSVPPRRRTKGNIRVLNDPKIVCSSQKIFSGKESVVNEVKVDLLIDKEHEKSSEASIPHAVEKVLFLWLSVFFASLSFQNFFRICLLYMQLLCPFFFFFFCFCLCLSFFFSFFFFKLEICRIEKKKKVKDIYSAFIVLDGKR